MSKDSVMKFFEAVRKDEAIVERLRALEGDTVAFARLSAELGRERGFAFEPSDVREAIEALARKNAAELSDRELSAVAGGGTFPMQATVGCMTTNVILRVTAGCQTAGCHLP